MRSPSPALFAWLATLASCDVATVARPPTGAPPSRGVLVVDSNYQASNVAALAWDGRSSPSLLSSGAAPAGLSTALSGDVSLPTEAPRFSGDALILDRTSGVLTWLHKTTAVVRAQLSVGDGFYVNPYDYVEISPSKAYVARYGLNFDPAAASDQVGGDLLVVDPRAPRVTGRISLAEQTPGAVGAYPARFVRGARDGTVVVLLQGFTTKTYCDALDQTLVTIDTESDRVVSSFRLRALKNCGAAVRLDRARIAVACSGLLPLNGCHEQRGAGLAIVRDDGDEMLEEASFSSDELGGQPLAPTIDAVSGSLVVFAQYGDKGSGAPDRWRSLDVDLGLSSLLEIAAGEPFSLGDLLCEPTLGACFGADGGKERKTIRRFELKDGVLVEGAPTGFVDPYGLEPRTLGKLL